ncbi:ABC transporter transmembrane domain-containing protein [Brevibacillus laterosporus]|uniref:ABC transporter ATP-binding protein n=1 Tax=Brevibacillus laterosporus TaxID=1465 RepID=UPI00035CFB31|nr:ABC transporter transmembrane domain-containing protein [Brevibacillus laterosporus]ATO48927.1 multidrug ABC transporter permease/ATP-binding protein [Brevibacillus laterosporus DSM 25]MED2001829.1 ABC transporter transmembrane domain-containing protein [Brevibacillus laterosporus]
MSSFRQLAWFFQRHWKRYVFAISVLIIIDILLLLPPRIIGSLVDEIRNGLLTHKGLVMMVGILVGIGILLYVLRYLWRYLLFGGSLTLEKTLRNHFFQHLNQMSPSFFQRHRTGNLMAIATNDIPAIETTASIGVLTLVDSICMTLLTLGIMLFAVDWKLTLAALLPMPFLAWSTAYYGKLLHERYYLAQEAFGKMNDHVQQSISGVRVLRSFVQEEKDVEAFQDVSEDTLKKNVNVAKIDALFEPTVAIIISFSFLIALGYGSLLVISSQISLGELVAFQLYLGLLIWPMFAFGYLMNVLQRGSASLKRLYELLGEPSDVVEVADAVTHVPLGTVEMRDCSFTYPQAHRPALQHISFTLNSGETLGIVGKTGSGKSTLCRTLLHQYPVESQQIFFSGIPIEQISLNTVREKIAYVPQEHMLFSRTVKENVAFGVTEANDADVEQVLRQAEMLTDLQHLSHGLKTVIGEKGVMLSGGQKQRISIARALLTDAEVLILDDSLSAVDARTEEKIIRHLREARLGKTTIITAHRLSAVVHAHHILVLDEGLVIEEGTHTELMIKNGWYAQQYHRQQLEEQVSGAEGGMLE